ncbi:unnamed protein product [Phytophthora fragariaefolia]|uniref:cellulose 1,4-beta-cellobiosidase (non-reducing end) n=1 Tax=Phytophthora fragariaefolia TaxID=1490495 RepID=A0A9W6YBF6_9STRA|nr:unnamed protein product [Phytophthora fragariaefolia]
MPYATWSGIEGMNSLTESQCSVAKTEFGDEDDHKAKGGLEQLGLAMKRGMVLTMSLWTDNAAYCLWLDSDYPVTADTSDPGVARGTCATTTGVPDDVISEQPDAAVVFSNIRFGDIGTTVDGISSSDASSSTSTSNTTSPSTSSGSSTVSEANTVTTAPSTSISSSDASSSTSTSTTTSITSSDASTSTGTSPPTVTTTSAPSEADDETNSASVDGEANATAEESTGADASVSSTTLPPATSTSSCRVRARRH